MPTGTIARLLIDKGFGFIRDEGGIEHFFHRSSVRQAMRQTCCISLRWRRWSSVDPARSPSTRRFRSSAGAAA